MATFYRFPQLFKDYFHVSSVMQAKGLVPFVHCGDAPAPPPPAAEHPLACIYRAVTSQEEIAVRKKQKELDARVRQLVETV